jgi:Protein of unknown function (DUF2721)
MDMTIISEAIHLATAPVFLLTGVAGILNALGNRLGRVIDRARRIEVFIENLPNPDANGLIKLERYYDELESLEFRKLIINIATAFLVLCAVLIALTVIELFFSVSIEPGKLHISNWVPITFIGSFISLVSACILYFVEIMYASHTISFKRIKKNAMTPRP